MVKRWLFWKGIKKGIKCELCFIIKCGKGKMYVFFFGYGKFLILVDF